MAKEEQYRLSSVSNALAVLDLLAERESAGLVEITHELGISKATAFRLLYTLEQSGFTRRISENRLGLGMKFAHDGAKLAESNDVVQVCRPYMQRLCRKFGCESHLFVLADDGRCRCIYKEFGDNPLQLGSYVGFEVAPHLCSGGKVLLAWSSEEKKLQYLDTCRFSERPTENSSTDPDTLRTELALVAQAGYAEDLGEYKEGSQCVAAPVFDWQGRCVAAVSLSGRTELMQRIQSESIQQVKETANQISQALGYNK